MAEILARANRACGTVKTTERFGGLQVDDQLEFGSAAAPAKSVGFAPEIIE